MMRELSNALMQRQRVASWPSFTTDWPARGGSAEHRPGLAGRSARRLSSSGATAVNRHFVGSAIADRPTVYGRMVRNSRPYRNPPFSAGRTTRPLSGRPELRYSAGRTATMLPPCRCRKTAAGIGTPRSSFRPRVPPERHRGGGGGGGGGGGRSSEHVIPLWNLARAAHVHSIT